jgi:hypothetical protein
MRRIKKQSMRMEELIKKLRAAPRNITSEPDSTATADIYSTATGEGDSPATGEGDSNSDSDMQEDSHIEAFSRGDADYTLYDGVVHCTVLSSEDAVGLVRKDVEESHDVWPTLKETNYGNLHRGKENNEERRSMDISKENQEMEESTNEETRGLEVSEKKQDQWEESEEALKLDVFEENGVKVVEDENGETLGLQKSELKEMELSATEEGPLGTNIEQAHMALGERLTGRQMKKLEKENRRQMKILKKLTEKRGEQLDQEFEPLRMQDTL